MAIISNFTIFFIFRIAIQVGFSLQENESDSDNKTYHDVQKLFLLIMLIVSRL